MSIKVLTFDVETTHTTKDSGSTTPMPYFENMLVSIGYKWLGLPTNYLCMYHNDREPSTDGHRIFQDQLNIADVVVGQNIKFDLQWLKACGYTYNGQVYDTMVAEYILSKARRWPLSLDAMSKKYGGVQKEKDLVKPYLDSGHTFYDIPYDIVEEYGKADVEATEHVALQQLSAFGTSFEELFNARKADTYA
jgi:DNA polymerase I-like protein with 3'-5' exonuclease and polymerase domains